MKTLVIDSCDYIAIYTNYDFSIDDFFKTQSEELNLENKETLLLIKHDDKIQINDKYNKTNILYYTDDINLIYKCIKLNYIPFYTHL